MYIEGGVSFEFASFSQAPFFGGHATEVSSYVKIHPSPLNWQVLSWPASRGKIGNAGILL